MKIVSFKMGQGICPFPKACALNTKYLDWWLYSGHSQHSGILEIYESDSDCH